MSCHAFLAWDEVEGDGDKGPDATVIPARTAQQPEQQPEYEVGTVLLSLIHI